MDKQAYIIDDEAKIANCLICTLADNMKHCNKCAFNIGLPFRMANKVLKENVLNADCLLRIEDLRTGFLSQINARL